MSYIEIRDDFVRTIDHIEDVQLKLSNNSGKYKQFDFADQYKLVEGLYLSAWTHWEEFLRALFSADLALEPKSALKKEIKQFRTKNAPFRLAELIVSHPDERKWVEWSSFTDIATRSDIFLGSKNRFRSSVTSATNGASPAVNSNDLEIMKRIRNAIAHKSDYAWQSFRSLVQAPPFGLTKLQMRGITVGRFLASHQWNSEPVLQYALSNLRKNAQKLVP